jgi:[acyl-carrier-protein] S-malonyltransferase
LGRAGVTMKDTDGRRFFRFLSWGSGVRPSPVAATLELPHGGASREPMRAFSTDAADRLISRIGTTALAFRGFDQSNLGRSAELLAHPAYGRIVREVLAEASRVAAEAIRRPVDLVADVRHHAPSTLERFPEDVALIVGMELAQLRILEDVFGVPIDEAKLSFGYSIGELSALVVGGVYRLDQILPVPLALAEDCARLAEDTSMGVLFTRGGELPPEDVERLCEAVRSEGAGLIGPSAYLSPNTALILGQGDTLDILERMMPEFLPGKAMLRRKEHRWPPLHSPLVWDANIPNRTAAAVYRIGGGRTAPTPRVISCVTGSASYDAINSRETLIRWTDAPQRLWDAMGCALSSGVETIVHVGPAPNLIPATFSRLSNNISKHLVNKYMHALGRGVVASMNRHAWLGHLLPSQAALLRAPFLEHIILEDWLLEQDIS